jgi:hypothetical protein
LINFVRIARATRPEVTNLHISPVNKTLYNEGRGASRKFSESQAVFFKKDIKRFSSPGDLTAKSNKLLGIYYILTFCKYFTPGVNLVSNGFDSGGGQRLAGSFKATEMELSPC